MTIFNDVSVASRTTFKIGGTVRYLIEPVDMREMFEAFDFIQQNGLAYFVLGEGSNTLIGSQYFDGVMISTLKLNEIKLLNNGIHALCGATNTQLSNFAYEHGLKELEFLYTMPGSLGGSILMNARCFGYSFSDIIIEVEAISPDGTVKKYCNKDIEFAYKKSLFQQKGYVVLSALFKRISGDIEQIKANMEINKKTRLEKGHYKYPSAGCVFKNNPDFGKPTGKIIDELGLTGQKLGGAEIYSKHGNFIINKDKASSSDVRKLIDKVKSTVKQKYDFNLECEIQFHGQF